MSRHPHRYPWTRVVSSPFPDLSQPLAAGLALWSLGLSIARSCRLTAVAGRLAPFLAPPFNPRRSRRRDRSREAPATAGTRRAQRELSACWAPWLRWGRGGWQGRQRALALEATTVGQRLVVLVIRVRSRGGAMPVAWKGLHATSKQPWQPEGVALLAPCPQVVPRGGTVLVRAARGVSARWLCHALVALGWHPRRRIHQPGQCRPPGWYHWVPVTTLVPRVGRRWAGPGLAFTGKDTPLACTLLGGWDAGHQDAWLVLPDLPPPAAQACW